MDSAELGKLRPLDSLSQSSLVELAEGASIEEFEDGDYICRLGEEIHDLLYVLDGSIEMMDMEHHKNEVLSHDDEKALSPFAHEVPFSGVAVARYRARILRINHKLLCSVLPAEGNINLDIWARKKIVSDPGPELPPKASEPEYLDLPSFDEENEVDLRPLPVAASHIKKKKSKAKQQSRKQSPASTASEAKSNPKTAVSSKQSPPVRTAPETPAGAKARPVAGNRFRQMAEHALDFDNSPVATSARLVADHALRLENSPVANWVGNLVAGLKEKLESGTQVESGVKQIPAAADSRKGREKTAEKASSERPKEVKAEARKAPRTVVAQAVQAEAGKALEPGAEARAEPIAEEKSTEVDAYLEAMSFYRQQDWSAAHDAFQGLAVANPDTILYRKYAERCAELIRESVFANGEDHYRRMKAGKGKAGQDFAPGE